VAILAPLTELVAEGTWGTVEFAVRQSGGVPAKEFFDSLPGKAKPRFAVLFQHMANYGSVSDKRFKKEMGKLFAFRHEVGKRQIRFPCFQDGNRWILTHGFFKPGAQKGMGKWPEREIKRAQEMETEYWARKKQAETTRGEQ
jgi:hypothetical protein